MNESTLEILKPMMFPVEKVSTSSLDVDTNANLAYAIIGYPKGYNARPKLLHTCSERFQLTTCEELFPDLFKLLNSFKIKTGEVSFNIIGDTKFYLFVPLENKRVTFPSLLIVPEVKYQHAYDNTMKFDQSFGFQLNGVYKHLSFPLTEIENDRLSFHGKTTKNCSIIDGCQTALRFFDANYMVFAERVSNLNLSIIKDIPGRLKDVVYKCSFKHPNAAYQRILSSIVSGTSLTELDLYLAIHQEYIWNNQANIMHPEFRQKLDKEVMTYIYNSYKTS